MRLLFLVSLAVMLINYPKFPDETGVHFIGVAYMPETSSFHESLMRVLFTQIYAALSIISFLELAVFAVIVSKDEKKINNTGNGDR